MVLDETHQRDERERKELRDPDLRIGGMFEVRDMGIMLGACALKDNGIQYDRI